MAFLKNVINAHEQDCVESMAFFLDGKDGDSLQVLLKLAVSSKHVEAGSGMLFFYFEFWRKMLALSIPPNLKLKHVC